MKWSNSLLVAIPVVLLITLAAIFFLGQPKVNPEGDIKYLDQNGDEYPEYAANAEDQPLARPFVTTEPDTNYFVPVRLSDCLSQPEEYRDTCYITYSALTEEPDGCYNIQDITDRSDCFARVAEITGDEKFCEEVKFGLSACYVGVAISTSNSDLCKFGDYEKKQCYEAYKTGNPSNCAEGDDRRFCIQAIFDKNVDMCQNINAYGEFCYYNVAIDSNNSSLCNKISSIPYYRDNCFFRVALETNNPLICENLGETRDNCIAWIAYNTGNMELCYSAGKEAQSCIGDLTQ